MHNIVLALQNKIKHYINRIHKESLFLYRSTIKRGLRNTLMLIYGEIIFDLRYKTKTTGLVELCSLQIESENKEYGVRYEGSNYLIFQDIFQRLNINFENSIFVDFGSGKGRALMMASDYNFKLLIGVEFSTELCNICEDNILTYSRIKQKNINFKIYNLDATVFKIPDNADVFYFFNPFDERIMNSIIDNIDESLKSNKREVLIIYVNAIHKQIFENRGYYQILFIENAIYKEHGVVVYKNHMVANKFNN